MLIYVLTFLIHSSSESVPYNSLFDCISLETEQNFPMRTSKPNNINSETTTVIINKIPSNSVGGGNNNNYYYIINNNTFIMCVCV